ncbi:MAG: hypothetical protein EA376_04485 [Phycisphaeraceae bacterium]|nr:MAG: hypothetical protein EA376_04485 [Phycisphaeraceae bacterium]
MPQHLTQFVRPSVHRGLCLLALLTLLGSFGCAGRSAFDALPAPLGPERIAPELTHEHARELPMFRGRDGAPIGWGDLMSAVARADVIMLGEQHDDALGHEVQRVILTDALAARPRGYALSLEMLERDEQILVDDFLEGIIDQPTFVRLTHSANWAGEGSWNAWYQPIIDVAMEAGAPVIAANAPRRYVRLARTDGYDRLDRLPRERRAFFDRPKRLPEDAYRDRFFALMGSMSHGEHVMDESRIEAIFRSQMVWDATMAASIVRAQRRHGRAIVHLVGQFHSDFEGGIVTELRRRAPGMRILTVSMQRRDEHALQEEDIGRADIVIHTGARPEPEIEEGDEDEAESEAASDDEVDGEPADVEPLEVAPHW